ncbi:MAG: TetR/AcrR family transcriptional regulator [Faecalibacterium sp.]
MNRRQELNAFVRECITTALLELMETQPFESIAITALTRRAGVSRTSFYRNFSSKEDVLRQHLARLTQEWGCSFEQTPGADLVESLFSFYLRNRELFIQLYKAGLWSLSLQSILDACGPKASHSNPQAYQSAFFAYGLYGWLEEWFKRGLAESPAEMSRLAAQNRQRST